MAAPDPAAPPRGCSGSTTSRSGAASTTARCSSTARPARRWTCWKAVTPSRWRTGWPRIPASRSSAGTAPVPTPTAPAPGHRRRSRSPTGSTCGRTSPRPSSGASPRTAPAWHGPVPARRRGPGHAAEPADAARPEPAGKYADRARRHHALVHGLLAEGRGLREIARHLGWGLHTVQRYARAATWQELADGRWQGPRASKLDAFKPYLDQHAGEGHGSITRLFRESAPLGYDGSYHVVRAYLDHPRHARTAAAGPADRPGRHRLAHPPPGLPHRRRPAPAQSHPGSLPRAPNRRRPGPRVRRHAHRADWPEPPAMDRDAREAGLPGISSFARGLEQDLDAVTNGLTMPWSSGPVEGRVNHIKTIKRQMFGRAGLPLFSQAGPAPHRPEMTSSATITRYGPDPISREQNHP